MCSRRYRTTVLLTNFQNIVIQSCLKNIHCPFESKHCISKVNKSSCIFHLLTAHPRVSLYPGPSLVIQGSNVTLPTCQVTGYPAPVVTWRKSFGQLPQGRVRYNNSVLQITDVRKVDSDSYICSAINLLGNVERKTQLVVVSLPVFTVKPPGKIAVGIGDTLTLNCSATGDPQPVISWKRQGGSTARREKSLDRWGPHVKRFKGGGCWELYLFCYKCRSV